MKRLIVVATVVVLIVLVGGVGYTTHEWHGVKSQLRHETHYATVEGQKFKAAGNKLDQFTSEQDKLKSANSLLQKKLGLETSLVNAYQSEDATQPTVTPTAPATGPFANCQYSILSDSWVCPSGPGG